jgi:hypothetical protein
MAIANFCNNNKLTSNLVSVSVSNVSRELKESKRVFVDQFHHKRAVKSVPLRAMESLQQQIQQCLKIELVETKR